MKKKNFKKTIVALSLTAVLGLGGTLAYLTATTGTKTNEFTSNGTNVTGETTETEWNENSGKKYQPGDVIKKNPTVKLDANSESAYVALKVEYLDSKGNAMSYDQFKSLASVSYKGVAGTNSAWDLAKTYTNGTEVYVYNTAVEANNSADVLFDTTTVNAGITTVTSVKEKTVYYYTVNSDGSRTLTKTESSKVANGVTYYDENGNVIGQATSDGEDAATQLPTFTIKITGYAVQSKNVDLATAKTQLIALADANK